MINLKDQQCSFDYKKNAFLNRDTISLIKLLVSNIFIPNNFPQWGDERKYNLYQS